MVVQGKARWDAHCLLSPGCSSYLNANQEHTVLWMQLQRVDPISSVEFHTTVLQKVSMLYFVNNFYISYRNCNNIYFQYTPLSSRYIEPNNLQAFSQHKKERFRLIIKWVTHCFLHLIICNSMTSYSIIGKSNRWKSKRATFGMWAVCSKTSKFNS
jgi:hypothetical protein